MSSQGAGQGDVRLSAKLAQVLRKHKIQVLTNIRVRQGIRQDGVPGSETDWAELAIQLKVDGFVDFNASQDGGKRSVDVVIRNGADGAVAGQETFTVKGPPKRLITALGGSFWKRLGSAVQQTARANQSEEKPGLAVHDLPPPSAVHDLPPPSREESIGVTTEGTTSPEDAKPVAHPAEPTEEKVNGGEIQADEEAEEAEEVDEKSATSERPVSGLPAVEVEVDIRALKHSFEYVPASVAPNYPLGFSPIVGGHASWYPTKLFGVFAQGEISVGLSTPALSISFPTSTREFVGGAQFRLPFSFGQLGANAGYFQHAFLVQDAANPSAGNSRLLLTVPNTVYVGARLAVNARFTIGNRVQVGAEGAYRIVTGAGKDIGQVKSNQYFPTSATPVALDGNVFVGLRLGSRVEIRGGLDYRRYAYQRLRGTTFSGTVIDAPGGLDQYIVVFFGAVGVFGRP